ncbi:MAG TPA: ABC-F family ATP-binding cassette domain-containing protein [Pseudogracilibacillus sp.]|nr:ABC-F family ATP-binding cassette domain-containing protein [Pseudogracilibacillus sp.]
MVLLQLKNIVKTYASNIILNDISLEVKERERIAVVGRNGSGKSTLLNILRRATDIDSGDIYYANNLDIGYLAQHNDVQSDRTIWEELLTVFEPFMIEENNLQHLAEEIEQNSLNGTYDEKKINEYSRREEAFANAGGYRYKSDVRGVLIGLGFPETEFDMTVNELSGGQKTRLALGKLLLQKPDLLLLDEPTNHLDIETLMWLESYLVNYEGAIVIVSHDRYFLDKVVSIVYEVRQQKLYEYHGTYSDYLIQKEINYERDVKQYEQQQKEIKEAEQFIVRNIARASTSKRAQSRRRQLEKVTRIDRPIFDEKSAHFLFDVAKTSGNDVIHVDDFSFTYSGEAKPTIQHVSFTLRRGERAALIGPNGIGKTTLLKAIVDGADRITLGSNVQIGYYAQEQETLDETKTILEEVWDAFPEKTEQEIRTVLGNFLFTDTEVEKHIHYLSGGEKARVALAKLMLKRANFLILDEPTNHLDLDSKEVLEDALEQFPGTILFVSHDRYFINKITDYVYELHPNGVNIYLGDYDYYIEKKLEAEEIKRLEAEEKKHSDESPVKKEKEQKRALTYEEQKRRAREKRKRKREIERIEQKIDELEQLLATKEEEMVHPDILQDHVKLLALTEETEAIKTDINELFETWELLVEE